MRVAVLAIALVACGSTHSQVAPPIEHAPEVASPIFAGHGTLTLRSTEIASRAPLYAELAADGSITGTRCAATRMTDVGALERAGTVIASLVRVDGALAVRANDVDTGWRIEGGALVTSDDQRFALASGRITPSGPELPSIDVDPSTADDSLALGLFALLLVCDDSGP